MDYIIIEYSHDLSCETMNVWIVIQSCDYD